MRLSSRRRDHGDASPEHEALEAELALLREENARLKVEAARPPSPGRAIDRLRGAAEAASADAVEQADDAWQALSEATMLREVLSDMCEEVQGAVSAVQDRLQAVAPQAGSASPRPALGVACDHCGAPIRTDHGSHEPVTPVHLRPAQAVGDGGVISS